MAANIQNRVPYVAAVGAERIPPEQYNFVSAAPAFLKVRVGTSTL
jgi:hypothetical protein